MPGPSIREAGAASAPVLAGMHALCFAGDLGGAAWNQEAIAKILSLPGTCAVLAWKEAAGAAPPLGFALTRNLAGEAEILSLGVLPAARRGGLGRAILGAIKARARLEGVNRLYLEVAEDNLAAQKLYLTSGFTRLNRRPAYYARPKGRVAALVLVWGVGRGLEDSDAGGT